MIDLRFFRDDVVEYAGENGITGTLVLFSVQNFVKNSNAANIFSLITVY